MKFEEILRQHNVPLAPAGHRHGSDGWVNFDCPHCGRGTRKFHMGYNVAYGYLNCRRCGRHPTTPTVALACGLAAGAAAALIRGVPRITAPHVRPVGRLALPPGIGELQFPHRAYLRKRGFNDREVEKLWGVRGIGIAARLPWRIWIPIYQHGEMVSWTTRAITDAVERRYMGAGQAEEAVPAKEVLYGSDYCQHGCIIHEGPTDVWATGPGAVCTLGTAYSRAQAAAMSRFLIRAICFDNEPEAQRRARRLCDELAVFPGETFNVVLTGKDPASAPRGEIHYLRRAVLGDE
jgi:hypothetical protein